MQIARQCVVEILRMAGLPELAEEAHLDLRGKTPRFRPR
jgi:hypothetical protein